MAKSDKSSLSKKHKASSPTAQNALMQMGMQQPHMMNMHGYHPMMHMGMSAQPAQHPMMNLPTP